VKVSAYDLKNRFAFHTGSPMQGQLHAAVRNNAHTLAIFLNEICPDSPELSLAMTKIEEAMFWANAAIARDPQEKADADG
jgi:hypothetical protein